MEAAFLALMASDLYKIDRKAISGLQKLADLYQIYQITPPGPEDQFHRLTLKLNLKAALLPCSSVCLLFIRELEEENFPVTVIPIPTGNLDQLVTTGAFGMYAVYNIADPIKLESFT